ncbi:hypothetical protein N0V86_002820 [Didymella sp. IMI 355093]|nr:hypothetical protein N0V86_002820 [Didymella sp. IMI 355093]
MTKAVQRKSEYDWTADDIAFERRIRVHADTVLEDPKQWAQHDLEPEQWVDLASLYESYGKYDDAERFYKLALDGRDPLQSEPDQAILAITPRLAKLYRLQSRPTLAIPLYRQYLETNGDLSDVATARVKVRLAMAVHNEGQYEEAEKLMRSGITVLEKHLGPKKVEVLAARNDLGSTLLRLKRYDEAKDEYQYVLDQLKEVVGMENPFTMRTLQNLARYYNLRGDYTRALPMFEQAFDLRRRVLGLEHPSTLRTWHNLAYVHCLLGQMNEAENMFASVVAAKEKVLGPLHWDTLNAMTGLANIYRTTGQTAKAHDLYKKTLERLEKDTDSRRQKMIDDIQQTLEADRVGTGGRVAHVIV